MAIIQRKLTTKFTLHFTKKSKNKNGVLKLEKRQLREDERKLTIKNLSNLKKDLEWLEYSFEVIKQDVDKGLKLKYEKALKDQNITLSKISRDIEISNEVIKNTEKQLKELIKGHEII